MSVSQLIELQSSEAPFEKLSERLLNGEIIVVRGGFHQIGLLEQLQKATYQGITKVLGKETSDQVRKLGLEKIHTVVDAGDIPKVTEAVFLAVMPLAKSLIKQFIEDALGFSEPFYFERAPNVRFHIPYDLSAAHLKKYKDFSKNYGDGKITPHNPHRDSWVECPSNAINVWIAVGSVKTGNGLTIYPESYRRPVSKSGPYLAADQKPGHVQTFDLAPGEAVLFHGDHLHGSEINSTDNTRYVISFRITLNKPVYKYGHHHRYLYSALVGGPFDFLAEVPQNLQWSYFDYRIKRLLAFLVSNSNSKNNTAEHQGAEESTLGSSGRISIPLSELKEGDIKPLNKRVCIARTASGEVKAFSRYCTHIGADLSMGEIKDGHIMCPWHNLPFDPSTGASPCLSLQKLKVFPCAVENDHVVVEV